MAGRDRRVVRDVAPAFSGGLNLAADPSALKENELRRAENLRLTEYGGATRRNGTRNIHATALGDPSPVRGGYAWKKSGSTELLVVAKGVFYVSSYSMGLTWSSKTGSLSATEPIGFAQFYDGSNDCVYLADGGALNKWVSGASITTDIASTPNVKVLAVYNERLFGITGTTETLYWSKIADGDELGIGANGGGSANIRTFGNQRLTGLLALGSSLLLFHVDGISRFTGISIDDIAIQSGTQGISQDTGTIAPWSILAVENAGFFAASRGFFMVTEAGVTDISAQVAPIFDELTSEQVALIRAVHNERNREIWFDVPGKGIYVYQYRLRAWSGPWTGTYTGVTTHALWDAVDNNGLPIVLRGTSGGFVQQCDYPDLYKDAVLSDGTSGSTYTMAMQPRRFFGGDPAMEKSLRWGYLLADFRGSSEFGVSWNLGVDGGSTTIQGPSSAAWDAGGVTWDSSVTWGGSTMDTFQFPMWGRGRHLDLTISDDGLGNVLLSRVEVEMFDMSRR
jgi:hypothetical protein